MKLTRASFSLALVVAFIAVLVFGGTTNAEQDSVPNFVQITQQQIDNIDGQLIGIRQALAGDVATDPQKINLQNVLDDLVKQKATLQKSIGQGGSSSSSSKKKTDEGNSYDVTPVSESEAALFAGVTSSCWEDGSCTLCDILVVLINITDAILKIFAILATVFFVYGAGYMMMSSGNTTMVEKGKGIIKATVIGSLIVLFSWQIMNAVVFVLVDGSDIFSSQAATQDAKLKSYSPLAWYKIAEVCTKSE